MSESKEQELEERRETLRERLAKTRSGKAPLSGGYCFKTGRAFWIVNGAILLLSLAVRLSSPATIMGAVSRFDIRGVTTDEVCRDVSRHLLSINSTSTAKQVEFNARVKEFDVYLGSVLRRLPKYSSGNIDLDFLTAVYAMKYMTGEWNSRKTPYTPAAAGRLKFSLLRYRKTFIDSDVNWRRGRARPSSWFIAVSQAAMGFTEGMLAPACILWRAVESFIDPRKAEIRGMDSSETRNGPSIQATISGLLRFRKAPPSLRLRAIFAPNDWRRNGPVFAVCALYGILICCYALASVSVMTKWRFFILVALLTLLYGMCFFTVCVFKLNEAALVWINRGVNAFMAFLDSMLT